MMKEAEVLDRIVTLSVTRLRICIEKSWVRPALGDDGHLFDDLDVARLQLIADLTEDMEVNDSAVPIILSLVDQVSELRQKLLALDRAVKEQDKTVVDKIVARLRESQL